MWTPETARKTPFRTTVTRKMVYRNSEPYSQGQPGESRGDRATVMAWRGGRPTVPHAGDPPMIRRNGSRELPGVLIELKEQVQEGNEVEAEQADDLEETNPVKKGKGGLGKRKVELLSGHEVRPPKDIKSMRHERKGYGERKAHGERKAREERMAHGEQEGSRRAGRLTESRTAHGERRRLTESEEGSRRAKKAHGEHAQRAREDLERTRVLSEASRDD
ncbi:hypothetical protein DENSPDRAFT_875513 [Dentipellis sp. KUC8613]|nr:hypothetical protein DENSPDRAFT_875513 [Dentipellis sp. KUC8613]